ncbi:hypothetical protein Pan44_06240 [Caulifigura coniformis]|uniref:Cytochrome C n=1 Tax=Caulifigura coniformis TaxID=2527983 RepID=A0A517S927_9PLAN|nr:hypothetical protein [Caulifigura coniformis]QDT52612.1 hypothetical protein Pan44_06240 [Caulifigura coniformis]
MRPFLLAVALSALGFGVYLAAGEAPLKSAPRDQTAIMMQAKLKGLHAMAEGLVRKDFSGIEQAGEALAALCAGDDWQHHGDPVYEDYRDQLRRSALKVMELARAQNLEGATYGYMGLMSSCVDCHTHCRDVLKIAETAPVLRPIP